MCPFLWNKTRANLAATAALLRTRRGPVPQHAKCLIYTDLTPYSLQYPHFFFPFFPMCITTTTRLPLTRTGLRLLFPRRVTGHALIDISAGTSTLTSMLGRTILHREPVVIL